MIQFLDPIGTGCKLILIKFSDKKTKIRIFEHTVQLVSDDIFDRISRKVYGDSRNNIKNLYSVIVRFIELFLIDETSSNVLNEEIKHGDHDERNERDEHNEYSDNCKRYFKQMAEYMIEGINELQKTYEYDNAVLALQLYSNLLRAGIDGTYNSNMLPQHLKNVVSNSLFDGSKLKTLWNEEQIKSIVNWFEQCFKSYNENDTVTIESCKKAINTTLKAREIEFKKSMII